MILPWRSPASQLAPTGTPPGAAGHQPGGGRLGPVGAHPAGTGAGRVAPARTESARPGPLRPDLPLPPDPMPLRDGSRPLKRWTWVGIFGPELMLCAGRASLGPLQQSFWAVWDRMSGTLDTETRLIGTGRVDVGSRSVTVRSGPARLELALSPAGEPVEVVSPHGASYIWTRKTPIRADGHFTMGMEVRPVSGFGLLDESAGYHARRTEWEWSAGVGTTVDGWPVTWNLVRGVHDSDVSSERSVWVSGRPYEVPPVRFGPDLDELFGMDGTLLHFDEEAGRSRRESLGVVSSVYEQPFGRFHGVLPGGVELSQSEPAFGVMERHRARW